MVQSEKSIKTCKRGKDGSRERDGHLAFTDPSPWIMRFAPLIRQDGVVLDLACGGGRHSRYLLDLGFKVLAVDKATGPIRQKLGSNPNIDILETDLETGSSPFKKGEVLAGRKFAGIIVSNYLWRPLFDELLEAVDDQGVLIYETFAIGNETVSKPRNPDHLLRSGELLDRLRGKLQIIAYETGMIGHEAPIGIKQRVVGIKNLHLSCREDGAPDPVALPET